MTPRRLACLILCVSSCAPPAAACIPGETDFCACPAGIVGTQTCLADGTFGSCACPADDAGVDAADELDAGVAHDAGMDAGPRAGHVFLLGHGSNVPDDRIEAMFANALAVAPSGGAIRIVELSRSTSASERDAFTARLDAALALRGRSASHQAWDGTGTELDALLLAADAAIVLTPTSRDVSFETAAVAASASMLAFARRGGIVVVTTEAVDAPAPTWSYVSRPGLLMVESARLVAAPDSSIDIALPADPIVLGATSYGGVAVCFPASTGGDVVAWGNSTHCPVIRHRVVDPP